MNRLTALLVGLTLATPLATSCGGDPVDEFRDAAPSAQGINLEMRSGKGQALVGDPALMPGVTRLAVGYVNGGVALTLGVVAHVVTTRPSKVEQNKVVWGPATRPLWTDEFRMTMTRDTSGYHYVVEGRAKGSTSEADFATVLTGTHKFGNGSTPGEGDFILDWTAAQELAGPPAHVGQAHVKYTNLVNQKVTLAIDFKQVGEAKGTVRTDSTYAFSQVEQGEGSFEFIADTNYATRTVALERLSVKSRWLWSGAGRSDVTGSGGDLAAPFRFSECWDTAFDRTHYNDTLGLFPTEGLESDCAFTGSSYSSL